MGYNTDTQTGPWFWSHTTIKYLDRRIINKSLICSQKVKEWTLKKRQTHFTRKLMRTWLKMKFFNYWTQKSLFFVYPYFTLDVNTWYECLIQILSEIKNLTFLNFKNFLNSFKMLSLLFCFYLFNLGFLQIRLFHNIVWCKVHTANTFIVEKTTFRCTFNAFLVLKKCW